MRLLRTCLAVAVLLTGFSVSSSAAAQGFGYGPVYRYTYPVPYPRQKYHGYWRDLGYGFTPQRTVYGFDYGYGGYAPPVYYPPTYYPRNDYYYRR